MLERLLEIGNDVVDVLRADGDTDEILKPLSVKPYPYPFKEGFQERDIPQ